MPRYVALVHAFDADLDLAVLRVATGLDGPVSERLPFVEVGDSDEVGLGHPITVLGYPGIGGKTITLTGGQVSGFLGSDRVADPRAWIKTSTTMAGRQLRRCGAGRVRQADRHSHAGVGRRRRQTRGLPGPQ